VPAGADLKLAFDALRAAIAARSTRAGGRAWTLREHLDGVAKQQWRSMIRDPYKRARRRVRPKAKSA